MITFIFYGFKISAKLESNSVDLKVHKLLITLREIRLLIYKRVQGTDNSVTATGIGPTTT